MFLPNERSVREIIKIKRSPNIKYPSTVWMHRAYLILIIYQVLMSMKVPSVSLGDAM